MGVVKDMYVLGVAECMLNGTLCMDEFSPELCIGQLRSHNFKLEKDGNAPNLVVVYITYADL